MAAIFLFAVGFPREFLAAISHPKKREAFPVAVALGILLPALYLFFVLIVVFAWNDVIAWMRFDGTWDSALNRADAWLLGGLTVGGMANAAMARLPLGVFKFLQIVYFGMFPQLGACIILLAFRSRRQEAMKFVAAIATAYYIALALFYFLPATGPYFLCHSHRGGFPPGAAIAQQLLAFEKRQPIGQIGLDYYIAFPCMHIAQPIIVLCFLRPWKRIAAFLASFDVLLIAAILLLQQHYIVDLLGGVAVALLAVSIVGWPERRLSEESRGRC